eukprot:COSAG02_NODE_7157_length_3137_cov_1.833169_1_plen_59_part_10
MCDILVNSGEGVNVTSDMSFVVHDCHCVACDPRGITGWELRHFDCMDPPRSRAGLRLGI